MNNIQKVSDITAADVGEYLRISSPATFANELTNYLNFSKSYIQSYTGLTPEEIDEHPDFSIVVLVLCQSMYDDRTLYTDTDKLNNVVESILGMYCRNLL